MRKKNKKNNKNVIFSMAVVGVILIIFSEVLPILLTQIKGWTNHTQGNEEYTYSPVSYAKEDSKAELTFALTSGKEAIITGGETGEHLMIPKTIAGYPVVGIESYAFLDRTEIRTVTIEEGIRYIGDEAFKYCASLQTVILPESLQYIGRNAFEGCENLTEVEQFPERDTYVDDYAFTGSGWEEKSSAEKFIIRGSRGAKAKEGQDQVMEVPYGITHLEPYFAGVISSTPEKWDVGCVEIVLPDTIISIESGVFRGLTIKKINLPAGIEEIPYLAFCDSTVEEILIPVNSNIKKIEESAFERSMVDVNSLICSLDKLEIIEKRAFRRCPNLYSLTLPSSVRTIGEYAFDECENLRDVSFEEGLLEISGTAFFDCSLERLQFPDSMEEIKGDTLCWIEGLERIYIPAKTEVSETLFNEYVGKSLTVYGQSGSDAEKAALAAGLTFIEVEEGKDMP